MVGVVQDPSGAVVAGARVQLTNDGTGARFQAQTSEAGAYVFDAVQPGSYTVAVEAPGFKRFTSRANMVTIGQPATVNVTLEVGDLTQQVEVAATAELVQTSTSGNIGNLIAGEVIRDLPIVGTRGRNPLNLVFMQPGVVSGGNTGGLSHAHGARDRAWNYTLDGIDTNETSTGGSETSPTKTNPDALAEFRVITGNFTADSGRNSGAQVAMVTRSGSNELHGAGFWFYRTPRLNANEWQNNLDGLGKRQFVQQIFGGSLGGPIWKNKTFFFANGQGLRALETAVTDRNVLTAEARKGVLRYNKAGRNRPAGVPGAAVDYAGNVLPEISIGTYNVVASDPQRIGLDPTVQALIAQSPLPNRFDLGDGLNTAVYRFTAAQQERQRDIVFKIDHIASQKNLVYARVAWGLQETLCDRTNSGSEIFPGTGCMVNTVREPRNLAFNWRWNPAPSVTNELVAGQNRFGYDFQQPSSLEKFSLVPPSVPNALDTTAQYYFGNRRFLNTWQVVDNLSYFRGAHAFKSGTNLRFQKHTDRRGSVAGLNANQEVNFDTGLNPVDPATFGLPPDLNTTYDRPNFQGLVNFLLGRVGRTQRGFVAQGDKFVAGEFAFEARYDEYDFYIQDTWKLRKNLTVDLGLRWETKMAPRNPDGKILRPDRPVTAASAPSTSLRWVKGSLYNDAWKNLGPSVGFAWDPFGTGKTSIRSNYRMAYDRLSTFSLSSAVYPSLPGQTIGVVNTQFGQSGGRLAQLKALEPPGVTPSSLTQPAAFSSNSNTVVDPSLKIPTTHQWSFGIQREIGPRMILDITYVGRRGYHLLGAYNVNQAEIFRNGFVDAFKVVKAGGESALINGLTSADSRLRAGETGSQMVRRLYSSTLNLNSAAELAASLGARIQGDRSVTDLSGAGPFAIVMFPQFLGGLAVLDSNDFSAYHGLEVQVERRFHNGLSWQASYTLSRSLDTRSYDPVFTGGSTGSLARAGNYQYSASTPFDMRNRRLNYAPSDFDRTHVLQSNWVVELPFGRGKRFGTDLGPVWQRAIAGWEIAGFLQLYSGSPFTVYSGAYTFSSVVPSTANCTGCGRSLGTVYDDPASGFKWYFNADDRARFSAPGAGELGTSGRNAFRRSRYFDADMSLLKRTRITESASLELRADALNLTNTPSFDNPTASITSSTFGRIRNSMTSQSRKIQLGAKIVF